MKAKYCIVLDGDGHFQICDSTDRKATIELLKKIEDGDYWGNVSEGYMEDVGVSSEADLLTIPESDWKDFLGSFEQRGTMELGTIHYTKQ